MKYAIPIVCATLFAVTANAGDSPFSVEGRLSFGVTDRQPGADLFLSGDGAIRLEFGALGLELGSYGYVNALDSPHETYGALTWDSALGRLSAGVPRPAYDSFAVSALERGFPTLGADRGRMTRSEATWGAMYAGYLPLGLRFDTERGAYRFALSAHRAGNADVSLVSLGAAWSDGPWTLSAALEGLHDGQTGIGGKMQAIWAESPIEAGIALFAPAAPGQDAAAEAFAAYAPTDRVTLTGAIQAPVGGGDPVAALSARYAVKTWAGLSAGVAALGDDPVFNALIDLRF